MPRYGSETMRDTNADLGEKLRAYREFQRLLQAHSLSCPLYNRMKWCVTCATLEKHCQELYADLHRAGWA